MNDDFVSLYAFNRWANNLVLKACHKLTPEQYAAEPFPGWSSVRSTVVHIAIVTEGWLRGLAKLPEEPVATEVDLPTVEASEKVLEKAYKIFDDLLPTLSPESLSTPITLRRGTRIATAPPWAVLRHIVNHSTYHRGQVASKLRRLGVEQPATDFIKWVIEVTPQQA